MIESLEERASSARQSIDEMTGSVTDREFDPPRRHVGTVTAVLFAIVLAAGGVWAVARGDGPQAADVAADGPDAVSASEDEANASQEPAETAPDDGPAGIPGPVEPGAFLVFDEAPPGFEPMIFASSPVAPEDLPTFDVYGSTTGDPFANGDLVVATIEVEPGETLVDPETPSVEVNGETIWIERDEAMTVVSHFQGAQGLGLLSQSLSEDELIAKITAYLETGVVDVGDLDLLAEDAKINFPLFGGASVVLYQPSEAQETIPGRIAVIVLDSAPGRDDTLVTDWFRAAELEDGSEQRTTSTIPPTTVEHNGWTVDISTTVESGLLLEFEVDGVPVQVTVVTDDIMVQPTIEDALALLGDIRGATPGEIEAMTSRGDDAMGG